MLLKILLPAIYLLVPGKLVRVYIVYQNMFPYKVYMLIDVF